MFDPADAREVLNEFFAGGDREFVPQVSVDCVILGFHEGELKVLLVRWPGAEAWSLPGGYVRKNEALDFAAERVLQERTGLDRIFLQQFHAFGGTDRREHTLLSVFQAAGVTVSPDHWVLGRVISVAYVALVDFARATPMRDALSEECRWWHLNDRPPLLFDHDTILARGLSAVRARLSDAQSDAATMAASLLPERFTMPELQRLYEAVLGRQFDRRNFQKMILERGLVVRSPTRELGVRHRARYLYEFAAQP
jgi:ADP-ribose pyrophosphatase YjhB (NUDIX family)